MSSISILETLPDELLLEICKYLLCIDVLLSFDNLNQRFVCLTRDYRRCVSLHKASYKQSFQFCTTILPQIGSYIQTLIIDNCYSSLQAIVFPTYFTHIPMSKCFPCLEKIILISFRPDPLLVLLNILTNLRSLSIIELRSLFRVTLNQQSEILIALFQANNQRIKSIHIDDQSCPLNPIRKYFLAKKQYSNIHHLQIQISTLNDLSFLLQLIPNIQSLNVSITKRRHIDHLNRLFSSTNRLNLLRTLQFKSVQHSWTFDELNHLFKHLPTIEHLSLNIRTSDVRLINGQILQNCLSKQIQTFHYAVHYLPEQMLFNVEQIRQTWQMFRPIVCLYNRTENDYMFLHTLPYSSFDYLEVSSTVMNSLMNYSYTNIQRLHIDCDWKINEIFPIIRCCQYIRYAMIWFHGNLMSTNEQQSTDSNCTNEQLLLPKLVRLHRLALVGSCPIDLENFSILLESTPNLFRLDLPYQTLKSILQIPQLCFLLRQRITALTINDLPSASSEQNPLFISHLVSIFQHIQHFYVDMRSLDTHIDEFVLRYLDEFHRQNRTLTSFCVDGKPSNELKRNAYEWLQHQRNDFIQKKFTAFFNDKVGRLLIWL